MEKITGRVKDLARSYGASAVGIVTTEMLAGGPPSTDLAYVLPNAKSAVSFAVALDQKFLEPWFNTDCHRWLNRHNRPPFFA
jgi:epoxyqueuosine reductase QueG